MKALDYTPAVDVHVFPPGIHWLFTNSTTKKKNQADSGKPALAQKNVDCVC